MTYGTPGSYQWRLPPMDPVVVLPVQDGTLTGQLLALGKTPEQIEAVHHRRTLRVRTFGNRCSEPCPICRTGRATSGHETSTIRCPTCGRYHDGFVCGVAA